MTKEKTVTEAIYESIEIYVDSLMAGDPDRWITCFSEDCIQMPPGGPMNIGKQMLYESISAWLDAYTVSDFKVIGDVEIQEAGDWAYSICNYSYHLTPKDGSPSYVFQGKDLSIFKRQPDGTWKLHRDCFNSNTPDH